MLKLDLEVKKLLQKNIKPFSSIIVSVSGGSDSVYLLYQCFLLSREYPFTIIVAHVNHRLRGKESTRDAQFVKRLAEKLQTKFEIQTDKTEKKGNLEEACREVRYHFLKNLQKKHKADWILTGHQQNENIETVLFHIMRGSYLQGLKGIEIISKKTSLFRPLLSINKEAILNFLKTKNIRYRVDKSNNNLDFSRNLIRHKIIPLIKKINPNFEKTFIENIKNFTETFIFIETYCKEWLKKNQQKEGIPLLEFLKEEKIIQKNILAYLYKKKYTNSKKFNRKHLHQILKILHQQKTGTKKEFGSDWLITIQRIKNKKLLKFIKV